MDKNKTNELVRILGQELKWNKARLICFSLMILALLASRTISLYKMAVVMDSQQSSRYRCIKEGSQTNIEGKKWLKAKKIFNHLNVKEKSIYMMKIKLWDNVPVFLAGSRSERGELMIVATNQNPKNAISIYLRRWEIESLFQSLKGRGFNFEQTHITAPERLEKVMALLALTFCWAHKVGEWRATQKPIPLNRYRDSQRPQFSYFRYGLDLLQELVFKSYSQIQKEWESCLQLIMGIPEFAYRQGTL